MSEPYSPERMTAILMGTALEAETRTRAALTDMAEKVEARAKQNASNGSHKYGTPTPAAPGNGPAVISGDLRRSITHTPVTQVGTDLETRVGPDSTPHRTYGNTKRGTTNSKIGLYLETGLRNGSTYPFLKPAFDHEVADAEATFTVEFSGPWKV